MPYILKEARTEIDKYGQPPLNAGELNYLITRACLGYLEVRGTSYNILNEIVGVLECAKQEFYRRVISKYEDGKIKSNGDVF